MEKYKLPHPLYFFGTTLSKEAYKKLIKSKVVDYWEDKLRSEASFLPSLRLFLTPFFSLCQLHRIWTQNYRKYTVRNIACENSCSDVRLDEQLFRQCHI